ncbi:MAG: hypothetical protein DBX41_00760 [Clostridiales bacterium]|nr:MAG: hypothetical protein DBX41_00760 [Clostridiales bacterium]
MNSCAYEEKMKRVEIYQSWLQEKQGMDITTCQKRVKLLRRLCALQDECGAKDNFLSNDHDLGECQKMIFLWSSCKEMKQSFGEESTQVQEMLKEYAKFAEDLAKGWQGKSKKQACANVMLESETLAYLREKLAKEFPLVYYIGDISINDAEYDLLLEYTKDTLKNLAKSKEKYRNDLLIVTFMVKTAQKYYKGKFWGAFFEQVKLKADQEYKNFLEKTLIFTLQKNDKYIVGKNERLNTIFFHAFICDYYANAWFELLLDYYAEDLNENLANHNAERYHCFLMGLSQKCAENVDYLTKSEAEDKYILREAAITAICANERASFIKAKQALIMIDEALKTKSLSNCTAERIKCLFKIWAEDSGRFSAMFLCPTKEAYDNVLLKVNSEEHSFYLDLGAYSILGHKGAALTWQIKTIKRKETLEIASSETYSGIKSEGAQFLLNSDELFGRIRAELYAGEEKLGEVLFKGEKLRTFTPEGVYSAKLILGKMYAYANKEISVQSFAITKRSDIGKLARYDLNCAAGEIVVIDNYEMRSLAANLTEGLNERGKIANLTAFDENRRALPVYGSLPVLAITVQVNKINASSIIINSSRYNLRSCRIMEFEKPDSKGVKIVLVDLREMPSFKDGRVNRVSVDIINSSSLKSYSFVYCQNLDVSYPDGAPLSAGKEYKVKFDAKQTFKNTDHAARQTEHGVFSFELKENLSELNFTLEQEKLDFSLKLAPIMYSTDGETWQTILARHIYAENLPEVLYLKNIATDKITLNLSDRFAWEYQAEDDVFTCDLRPLSSALNYFSDDAELDLLLDGVRLKFAHILLHNILREAVLACDYDNDELIFKCAPLKDEPLYADILNKNEIVCTKMPLTNGETKAKALNLADEFFAAVYSKNERGEYRMIYEQKMRAFAEADLAASFVLLKGYSDTLQDEEITPFGAEYVLYDLKTLDDGIYQCAVAKKYGAVYKKWLEQAEAEFYFDSLFSKCHLTFYQEDDEAYNDFLVDLKTGELLTAEDEALTSEEKYSRYKMMFDGECVYYTSVLPACVSLKNAETDAYTLNDLGFAPAQAEILTDLGYQNLAEINTEKLAEQLGERLLKNELCAKVKALQSDLLEK